MKRTVLSSLRGLFGFMGLCLALTVMSPTQADSLPAPTGKVILVVSGNISNTNSDKGAEFDFEMLRQLGLVDKQIATAWAEPDAMFTGVLTRDLMKLVGANGEWVRAKAANDYSVNIPMSDLSSFDTLLAMSHNGKRMRLRDKGPLWILYPNNDRPDEPDAVLNNRMIWQLTSLQIH